MIKRNLLAIIVFIVAACAPAMAQFQGSQFQPGTPLTPGISSPVDAQTGIYFGVNRLGVTGHLETAPKSGTTIPVLSSCGTTPTLATGSSDVAGTVTMGTSATGCIITFGTAYTAAPSCSVSWQATPLASQSYTVTATAITTVQTSTSNNVLNYTCVAKTGG